MLTICIMTWSKNHKMNFSNSRYFLFYTELQDQLILLNLNYFKFHPKPYKENIERTCMNILKLNISCTCCKNLRLYNTTLTNQWEIQLLEETIKSSSSSKRR